MAQARRTGNTSYIKNMNRNKTNNNATSLKKSSSAECQILNSTKQNVATQGIKVLGQDEEISEDMLLDEMQSGRSTPMSSRSRPGSRPVSNAGTRKSITPSKQVPLQAVKRIEEKDEELGPIDWNEFNISNDDRMPNLSMSESDIDNMSLKTSSTLDDDRLSLVEQRAREMTSALSSHHMDNLEADLSKKLDLIDIEREKIEQRQQEDEERYVRKSEQQLTVQDGQFSYRNQHFRDLSHRDNNDKISSSFIFDGQTEKDAGVYIDNVKTGSQVAKKVRVNDTGRFAMDKKQETVLATESRKSPDGAEAESNKKEEASADTDSSDEEDDKEDLIGEKGTAPNALLMEFLTCVMEEDYENAEKLCKMILIYEPDNKEALNFFPLIQERLKQEKEEPLLKRRREEEESDGSSSEDSEDSGEDSSADDSDSDDDDDSDSHASDDDHGIFGNPDSGIASTTSNSD